MLKSLVYIAALSVSAQVLSQPTTQPAAKSNYVDEVVANLSGRLKSLDLVDSYYSAKAAAWLDAARTELSQTALRESNQKLVNDLAFNAEQIIMAIEAGSTGFRQIALPTVETTNEVFGRSKELLKLYTYKNCLTPMRGHFEVSVVYAQTTAGNAIGFARLNEINKRVIEDQRKNCAEFTPIVPSGEGVTTQISTKTTLKVVNPESKPLASILATNVPDDLSVFINGDIAAMPLVVDPKKDWYEGINEALIPKGLEMKFDVSKRSLHLGPFLRTKKNDVPGAAFSVNTLLAHWAAKSNLTVTTEGALVDYALTQQVRAEEFADDLRIAVQQLISFYKDAGIPISAEIRDASIHITNQLKAQKETK